MNFIDKFNNILQNDEKVVDITCANKKSCIMKKILFPLILLIVVTISLPILHFTSASYTNGRPTYIIPIWVCFLVFFIFLAIFLLVWLVSYKAANNYYICLTDKRLIVRQGIFTVDYRFYAIDKVTGNISIDCLQSIFDKPDNNCALRLFIELFPARDNRVIRLHTLSIVNGYAFSAKINKQIMDNTKMINEITLKN